MKRVKLQDGTRVFCLKKQEAITLDQHISGYLSHGIEVKDGDTIFDVGGNIGLLGVRMTQRFPKVQVYAFEPIPSIFEVLKANAQEFGPGRYHPLNCGLSDQKGTLEFTYFPNSPALSTANPEMWDEDPKALQRALKGTKRNPPPQLWWMKLIPDFLNPMLVRYLRKGSIKVKCPLRTVSEVIAEKGLERVDLLKIDCEGAELAVLQGIAESDWPKIGKTVVEVHDTHGRLETVKELLTRHGFTRIHTEKEEALKETSLVNVFAVRE